MHISDMHFGIPEKRQTASDRKKILDSFIACFTKLLKSHPNWAPDILAISGDIAWSGSIEDYVLARKFFSEFLSIPNNKISPSEVVACFGNHDACVDPFVEIDPENSHNAYDTACAGSAKFVKRPPSGTTDTSEVRAVDDKYAFMPGDAEAVFHRFQNAEEFCNSMGFAVLKNNSTSHMYKHAYGSCRVKGIDFICLNTEWDFWGSKDKDAKGHLRIGQKLYNEAENQLGVSFTPFQYGMLPRVVVFHRSLEHLHESEQFSLEMNDFDRCVGNLIHQNDVTLNGHEHVQHIERFNAHTRIFAGAMHSTDARAFNCNLIAIPQELKQGQNRCEARKYTYVPSNPYSPWQLDKPDDAESFFILRLKETSNISEFLNIVHALRTSSHGGTYTNRLRNLIPLLTNDDKSVLMTLLTDGVFQKIVDYVDSQRLSERTIKQPIQTANTNPVETATYGADGISQYGGVLDETEQYSINELSLTLVNHDIPTSLATTGFTPAGEKDSGDNVISRKTNSKQ